MRSAVNGLAITGAISCPTCNKRNSRKSAPPPVEPQDIAFHTWSIRHILRFKSGKTGRNFS